MKFRSFISIIIFIAISFFFAVNVDAAKVTGKIVYEGKFPKLRPLKMDADQICLLSHGGEKVLPQTIALGPNKEMKNVFLHIAQGVPKKNYPTPTEPVVLDQKGCMYEPAVFGVMVGQPLKILNPDGTLHNVHALPKINTEFNLAMPKFRKETTRTFDKPELRFQIKCDVHPWMVTWANVMAHPFFDVSNEEGIYEIGDLPPGNYVLEAWQQRLAPQKVPFTITSNDEVKEINFTFSRPDKKIIVKIIKCTCFPQFIKNF